MNIQDKTAAVALIGNRTRFLTSCADYCRIELELREQLTLNIRKLYTRGFRTFAGPLTDGFALWAADTALMLREAGECPGLRLTAVLPFRGQEADYDALQRITCRDLLYRADEVTAVAEHETPGCRKLAHDFLLRSCSVVLAWADLRDGEAYAALQRAEAGHIPVIDLCAERRHGVS